MRCYTSYTYMETLCLFVCVCVCVCVCECERERGRERVCLFVTSESLEGPAIFSSQWSRRLQLHSHVNLSTDCVMLNYRKIVRLDTKSPPF